MDYREWGHGSRDPLDGVAGRPDWDDEEYEAPRRRYGRADGWVRDPPEAWQPNTESWQTGTGWVTVQPSGQGPDGGDYLVDPRHPPPAPHDWYAPPPAGPPAPRLPAPRLPAEAVPRLPAETPPRRSNEVAHRRAVEAARQPEPRQPGPASRSARRPRVRPRPRPRAAEDEFVEPEGGFLRTVTLTVLWYAVPVALYVLWALTLGGTPERNCLDPAGNPCGSPRAEALETLVHVLPRLATAVALSLVIAIVMRWVTTWRAVAIGFASSVVGAGIATVIFSVIGRPAG